MSQYMKLRKLKNVVEIKDEVDKYINESSEDPSNKNFNLLDWWKETASRYSILSKISKDIIAVPASTVASESAFSLGSRVVNPFRATLTPKMVDGLVCLNNWLRELVYFTYYYSCNEEVKRKQRKYRS
ncbi:hypothetical protein QQ045_017166 [Rhodiola kirilowii]